MVLGSDGGGSWEIQVGAKRQRRSISSSGDGELVKGVRSCGGRWCWVTMEEGVRLSAVESGQYW